MATLVYSDVNGVDRSFSLGPDPITVGRAPECAIRSDDPRVSRVHARFYLDQGSLWVEDLGSANGIYVGPSKIKRAQVPIGEIVLVGSLMIRLLPVSGTLPPPIGLHGTLAQWLEMERKARAAVEEERDAFVKRVAEMFEEVRTLREAGGAHESDADRTRDDLQDLRRASAAELEGVRGELVRAREAKMIAETQAGISTVERLAESDMVISGLQHQLNEARAAAASDGGRNEQAMLLAEQLAVVTARADKAEHDVATAQIRAQGAERNLAGANMTAAKAEARAAELEHKLGDAAATEARLEGELAAVREQAAALELRLGAVDVPVQAAEARAAALAAELAEITAQFETRRDRLVELEQTAATATADARTAKAAAAAAKTELADADQRSQSTIAAQAAKLAAADTRATELEAQVRRLGGADVEIAAARKARDDARDHVSGADKRIADAVARSDESDKRASAADTMAKAMAKDVAEALRRAADADTRARGVARELDGAHRRAEAAEKRDGERAAATRAAVVRAETAEATFAELRAQLAAAVADGERRLSTRTEEVATPLNAKLDQTQRELAAERSSAMGLVDRKTQLERELSELRGTQAGAQERVRIAEAKVAEYDAHVEELEDRIQDLESRVAVEQTASQSTLEDSTARVTKLEEQLAETKAAAKAATKTAANLEKRVDATETQLAAANATRLAAEAELAEARGLLEDAERRAHEAEARVEPLVAKADAADLAIGQASALQRQLEESLQKLSWMERDHAARPSAADVAAVASQLQAAETRARDAETRARAAESRAAELDIRARDADQQAATATARGTEIDARARDIEARAKDAVERMVDAERRARDAQAQLAGMSERLSAAEVQAAEGGNSGLERQLAAAQNRITELKREVDAAENVRQFAANTEREIAKLERELRELKAKLTQVTLERDRLSAELRDVRDDSETSKRRVPEPEAPAQADLKRYTALVARATELEHKLQAFEKEDDKLRRRLADAEARVAAQARAAENEPTNANAVSIAFVEHLSTLEESIESLRANMRAASDETAIMEQSDSVVAVSSAVSQAAEHVERARDALKTLAAMVVK